MGSGGEAFLWPDEVEQIPAVVHDRDGWTCAVLFGVTGGGFADLSCAFECQFMLDGYVALIDVIVSKRNRGNGDKGQKCQLRFHWMLSFECCFVCRPRPALRFHRVRSVLSRQLIFARSSTDLPSSPSIGSFFPALTLTRRGQYLSAFALFPGTSFAQSSTALFVCWTMSWPSTMDQTSGLAGRTLPTLAA